MIFAARMDRHGRFSIRVSLTSGRASVKVRERARSVWARSAELLPMLRLDDHGIVAAVLQVADPSCSATIMVTISGETYNERSKGKDVRTSNIVAAKVSLLPPPRSFQQQRIFDSPAFLLVGRRQRRAH